MTIILDNYPPLHPPGGRIRGRKNSRIIVGENYCHFGASYIAGDEYALMIAFNGRGTLPQWTVCPFSLHGNLTGRAGLATWIAWRSAHHENVYVFLRSPSLHLLCN